MKHIFADRVVIIAELTIKREKTDEFLDYAVTNLKVSRAYPGNIEFDILVDEAQRERVTFYEVWASSEAQRAYMAWRIEAGDLTELMSFLAGEPKFTTFRRIAT